MGRWSMSPRRKGFLLLLVVNLLWVVSSEIMRWVFVDGETRRPLFCLWFKSSLLILYFLHYLHSPKKRKYKPLRNETTSLSREGFELVSNDEDSGREESSATPRVRFNTVKEVRRMPDCEADEAEAARRGHSSPSLPSLSSLHPSTATVFILAPMWLACSLSYQGALLFSSVSSLNLVSCSSSLFVLLFSLCLPSSSATFTCSKAVMVLLNVLGVSLLWEESPSAAGMGLALFSAIAYAVYLMTYARFLDVHGDMDMSLLFGSMGVMSLTLGSFLLLLADGSGMESLWPLPSSSLLLLLTASAIAGTLLADLLWLVATELTDCLASSLSLSLAIPTSFVADALRGEPPTFLQVVAAVPITLSFVGASLMDSSMEKRQREGEEEDDEEEREELLMDEAP